ncbi:MAG: methyltransferase domain-containing protein [Pseudonocardiaceae bacterium]
MTATPLGAADFDEGLTGRPCRLVHDDGTSEWLPVQRWRAAPDAADEALLLCGCTGPTVDIGCGPGRLAAALTSRGVVTLGVDTSPLAVALTLRQGGVALHRDVFDRLPGEGRWSHVLLADGNIGIGGDPARLLRRAAELLRPGGTVLTELGAPGTGLRYGAAWLEQAGPSGPWFRWARVAADAASAVAAAARLRLLDVARHGTRWAARFEKP